MAGRTANRFKEKFSLLYQYHKNSLDKYNKLKPLFYILVLKIYCYSLVEEVNEYHLVNEINQLIWDNLVLLINHNRTPCKQIF